MEPAGLYDSHPGGFTEFECQAVIMRSGCFQEVCGGTKRGTWLPYTATTVLYAGLTVQPVNRTIHSGFECVYNINILLSATQYESIIIGPRDTHDIMNHETYIIVLYQGNVSW